MKQQKFSRVTAYISRGALMHNVQVIREKTGPDVRVMAVVKSDAYGHGADLVVPELLKAGIDAFAVAALPEGLMVRQIADEMEAGTGIHPMILILGYTDPSEYRDAILGGIDMTVFSLAQAEEIEKEAESLGKKAGIQIKLETGMQRIGFPGTESAVQEIAEAAHLPNVEIHGAFTHFARADEASKAFADEQQQRFEKFLGILESRGVAFPMVHSANSAAIMEYPSSMKGAGKMVRAGIMLYGLYPSEEMDRSRTELRPVMSLTSHVTFVKEVEAGVPVGYGGTFVTGRPTRIATVCIGYGDGYPRHLSNKGCMLIHGKRAPILGRVCMDQTMVDVTDIPETKIGDTAVLFGKGLEIDEVAENAGTISYEILCQLTPRIERVMTE